MTLANCISPVAWEHFVSDYLGKGVGIFKGNASRFADLVTLPEIEAYLSRLVVFSGMLRLNLDGIDVPHERYLVQAESIASRRVKTSAFENYMKNGATLIIEHAEGAFKGIHAMCHELRQSFETDIRATLFVVLNKSAPTRLHSDDHDVFVCQVTGRKHWPVYRPLDSGTAIQSTENKSLNTTVWEGDLDPGDALYVPNGWPHQPAALAWPCIHVTFDILRPTGVDFLTFVTANLTQSNFFRTEIPLLLSSEDRRSYCVAFRQIALSRMTDDILEAYGTAHKLRSVIRLLRLTEQTSSLAGPKSE